MKTTCYLKRKALPIVAAASLIVNTVGFSSLALAETLKEDDKVESSEVTQQSKTVETESNTEITPTETEEMSQQGSEEIIEVMESSSQENVRITESSDTQLDRGVWISTDGKKLTIDASAYPSSGRYPAATGLGNAINKVVKDQLSPVQIRNISTLSLTSIGNRSVSYGPGYDNYYLGTITNDIPNLDTLEVNGGSYTTGIPGYTPVSPPAYNWVKHYITKSTLYEVGNCPNLESFTATELTVTNKTLFNNFSKLVDVNVPKLTDRPDFSGTPVKNLVIGTPDWKNHIMSLETLSLPEIKKLETNGQIRIHSQSQAALKKVTLDNLIEVNSNSNFDQPAGYDLEVPNLTRVSGDGNFHTIDYTYAPKLEVVSGTNNFRNLGGIYNEELTTIGNNNFNVIGSDYKFEWKKLEKVGNNSLTSVKALIDFPTLTTIGENSFSAYYNSSINLPKVKTIGTGSFLNTKLQVINVPELTELTGIFNGSSLATEVNLPNVTTLKGDNLMNSLKLESLVLPKLATVASSNSFLGTPLTYAEFPELKKFPVKEENFKQLTTLKIGYTDPQLFITDFGNVVETIQILHLPEVITYPKVGGQDKKYSTLPQLRELYMENFETSNATFGVFSKMSTLEKVSMSKVKNLPPSSFSEAVNLTTIHLPELEEVGERFLENTTKINTLNLPKLKTAGQFFLSGTSALKEVSLPELVTITGGSAFNNSAITHLELPKLEKIGGTSFWYMDHLKELNVPNLVEIGYNPLRFTNNIQKVIMPKVSKMSQATGFAANGSLRHLVIGFETDADFQQIPAEAYKNLQLLEMPLLKTIENHTVQKEGPIQTIKTLETFIAPELEQIGNNSFNGLNKLNRLEIPQTQSIGTTAFQGLRVTDYYVPNLETVQQTAFVGSSADIVIVKDDTVDTDQFDRALALVPETLGVAFYDGVERYVAPSQNVHLVMGRELNTDTAAVSYEYQWLHNDNLLENMSDHQLPINDVQVEHGGNYVANISLNNESKNSYVLGSTSLNVDEENAEVPLAPTVDPIYTNTTKITGKATAGREIFAEVEGKQIATVVVPENGEFSMEIEPLKRNTEVKVFITNLAGIESEKVSVIVQPETVEIELDPYYFGDTTLYGSYTGQISLARLQINGVIYSWGGTFKDGRFSYYVGSGAIKDGQDVQIDFLDEFSQLITSEKISPLTKEGGISKADYVLSDSTITGTYEGDVKKGRLSINGQVTSAGGDFKNGVFSYYVNPTLISPTDLVTLQGLDGNDNPIGEPVTVTLSQKTGQFKTANYILGESSIHGTYEGEIRKARLFINDVHQSWGGSFSGGKFSYYVSSMAIKTGDKVELQAYDSKDQPLGERMTVAVSANKAEIISAEYRLGTNQITGTYTGTIGKARLVIDGNIISWGGDFKADETFSYYVNTTSIKENSEAYFEIFDRQDNKLSDEKYVISIVR
ncbi:immunoglobulin-like domain-containing protein [Enterococcus rotai]|uniref:immunoglobulin-like domain-containing protein n=1 Tax=Enterococcus rotai TaxID=118060 RepID=UPI0032B4B00B